MRLIHFTRDTHIMMLNAAVLIPPTLHVFVALLPILHYIEISVIIVACNYTHNVEEMKDNNVAWHNTTILSLSFRKASHHTFRCMWFIIFMQLYQGREISRDML
jgi:hypothetical protein